ncbi:MAG: glycoside hydrolase family 19 protein [Ferruginibacter sp.]
MMINKLFFFTQVRLSLFDGKLKQSQVDGITAILDEWEKNNNKKDDRWLAYMLSTTHHETGATMQPIEEFGKGKSRPYGKKLKMSRKAYTDTDNIFYGRGFVQLTWYENYEKAGKKLNHDFINNPEKVMELANASRIMFLGMTEGWFTGKKLGDYFTKTKEDWVNARRIINGLDRAEWIASYAKKYYAAISYTT